MLAMLSTRVSSGSSKSVLDSSERSPLYNKLRLLMAFCKGVGNGSSGKTETNTAKS
ncbi:hypothetical protein DPMN_105075 [Dreissena polymorpha]|uniref:Uncharacterized protein n=1 Tax=Dreissena polymorpha TaxID=45954 RepID=A0A9D4H8W3_DREPO|nr:hypothetical protein DPMN_105075 [Dreissena polymorpha]